MKLRINRHSWRLADSVEVLDGPRRGQVGQLLSMRVTPHERAYKVFFDDCCQPYLPAEQLRLRQHSAGWLHRLLRKDSRLPLG